MVLESQTGRAGAGRMYMSSRRRKGNGKLLAAAGVVIVIGVICYFMIGSGSGNANPTTPPGPVAGGGGTDSGAISGNGASGGVLPPPRFNDPSLTPAGDNHSGGSEEPAERADKPTVEPTVEPTDEPAAMPVDRTPPAPPAPLVDRTPPAPPVDRTPPAPPVADTRTGVDDPEAARFIKQARQLIQQTRLVSGRDLLNQILASDISARTAAMVRSEIAAVNEKLVFSPLIAETDPHVEQIVVQPGDVLSKIAAQYNVTAELLKDINRLKSVNLIRAGQRLKVVKGPFHVEIFKRDYRADLYLGEGADRMYVRSFRVGLGEFNSTPVGKFHVRAGSKLVNPEWPNPRTGQLYHSNDPANPIGERWIGLKGAEEATKELLGYGLHGTIEPQSIGKQSSMGCVRMLPDDIALVFDLLVEKKSTVVIRP